MRPFAGRSRPWAFIALTISLSGWVLFPGGARGFPAAPEETTALSKGRTLVERGAYEEAIAYYRNELSSAKTGVTERGRIHHVLDYLLLYAGRVDEAIGNAQAAYDWALGQRLSGEADAFKAELALLQAFDRAVALRLSNDIAASNAKFEEADRLAGALKSPPLRIKIADAWSTNYWDPRGDQSKYLILSLRALELANSLNYRAEAAKAANKAGTCYALKSDYSRALSCFLKALDYLGAQPKDKKAIRCLNNIAGIYASLGDYVKAKDYLLDAASRIPENATGAFETSLLLNLGNLFGGLGRRFHSEDSRQRALDCFAAYLGLQEGQGGGRFRFAALAGKADIYLDQGRLEEAREILASALEGARKAKSDPLALGKILSSLGEWALRTGSVPEAERYFKETRSISEQTRSPLLAMNAASGLGRCAEARGDYGQAIESYDLALNIVGAGSSGIVSDVHQAEFIGRGREPFQALIRLYLGLSKDENDGPYAREIFRLSESMRARSYRDLMERLSKKQPRPGQAAEDPKEAGLDRERIGLLKALSRGNLGREERERLERRIVQIDDLLDAAVFDRYGAGDSPPHSPMPVLPAFLQNRVLDDRTAILEYLLGETKSVLFCISRDSFHLVELPAAAELEDALTGFLSFLEDPSIPVAKGLPAAQRLYQILLAPVEALLPARADRLIIVPDGILFRLPFEALALPAPKTADPAYLNDRFTVSYAPSASSLSPAGTKPDAPYAKKALAFGVSGYPRPAGLDPRSAPFSPGAILDDLYGRRGFAIDAIPHVGEEISDLERRIAPGKIDVLQEQAATERALKGLDLRAYQMIHLACHAFSDDNYPLRSALLMSPVADDREDGYLQVSEMYDLRTNADLVVLSACQTGRGTTVMNEGNLGLPRVFFYMGAKSVLSTLWPINDKAGAVFIKHFYDAYFRGDGKAASLRAAKKAMRETRFAHPFFWASYVLTGEF